jgi:heptaprenylglyceryl phosphate synthase
LFTKYKQRNDQTAIIIITITKHKDILFIPSFINGKNDFFCLSAQKKWIMRLCHQFWDKDRGTRLIKYAFLEMSYE